MIELVELLIFQGVSTLYKSDDEPERGNVKGGVQNILQGSRLESESRKIEAWLVKSGMEGGGNQKGGFASEHAVRRVGSESGWRGGGW